MDLLKVIGAAFLLAACYQPELRDCTVSCSGAGDCATGQICNDGWCASPDVPSCANDDAAPAFDARVVDAGPPDAMPDDLHVVVEGRGKVVIDSLAAECVGTQGTPGDCHYAIVDGTSVTLLPVQTSPSSAFVGWTTANCSGSSGSCTLVIDASVVLVGAQFQ